MNHGPSAATAFVKSFLDAFVPHADRTVIIFPSALSFSAAQSALTVRKDIKLGVQNVHAEEKGAFTGENSAPIAKDAGAEFVLVGHSERRHVFGESDELCGRKVGIVLKTGLVPVLCVGEKIEEREAGNTNAVVLRQLHAGVKGLSRDAVGGCIIAYEPVWAIGTGRTATPQDAQAVHAVIRAELSELAGDAAADIPVLYGGSVTPANASALLDEEDVDGLLVGGASLDPASWTSICSA
jgi:triosephosphate isomerase